MHKRWLGGRPKHGEGRSLTVTYRRRDGHLVSTKVGYGTSHADCLAHADAQLMPGRWVRIAVSSPASVYADVINDGRPMGRYVRKFDGEGVTVVVAEPRLIGVKGGGGVT